MRPRTQQYSSQGAPPAENSGALRASVHLMAFFDGWGRDVVTRRAEVLTRAVAAADVAGLIARGVIGTFSKPSSLFCRLSPTGDTRFANSPKRSMGHVLGAKKRNFLIRGAEATRPHASRAGLILSIPAKQVSLGSPRVGTIHVQSPTPHTPPLQSFLVISLSRPLGLAIFLPWFASRALREH